MSLGENLSETGKSDGLTRESVAETLGVSANEPVDYAPQLKEIERVIEKKQTKRYNPSSTGRRCGARNIPSSPPTATVWT